MSRRLSALDEAFLNVETENAHMHVGWAAVFDPPVEGSRPRYGDLAEHIAHRLPRAPRFRQMLRQTPLRLSAPVWVDDPAFDVSRHVLAASSSRLGDVVDECMSEPLRRDRPLWQIRIADDLDDGRIGVVGKAHHCMVDGLAAVELASLLLDPEPDVDEPDPDHWRAEPGPGPARLVAGGLLGYVRGPLGLARLFGSVATSPRRALAHAGRAATALADAARPAARRTPLNPPITGLRHLGFVARGVDDLVQIKRGFGVKLNDVFLAVCAGAVRGFLRAEGEPPIRLKAMVPVNVREPGAGADLGNRLAFMFVDLPCDEPDPARRLEEVHAATSQRKASGEIEGASDVLSSLALAPSPMTRFAARVVASPRVFNLVVSNIPGPRESLYMRGCELAEVYPVVPIADRHALSIGVTTLGDGAFFGLYADPASLPDVDHLELELDRAIDELAEAAASPRPRAPLALA